ncbi:MAG: VWA domain-containing protein [Oscillospiraceae bacterium]|nr:VWA domain-containing protein [Oscillospiraceae bacterium]
MKRRMKAIALAVFSPAVILSACGSDMAKTEDTMTLNGVDGMEYSSAGSADFAEEAAVKGEAEEAPEAAEEMADEAMDEAEPTADPEKEPAEGDDEIIEEPDAEPSAGQPFVLTAGEWNDNENWGFFANLVNTNLITFPAFGLQPCTRVAVTLTNAGEPVRNQTVQLMNHSTGDVIWSAATDKNGNAYLFYPNQAGDYRIVTTGSEDIVFHAETQSSDGQGSAEQVQTLEYNIDTSASSVSYGETEVMFILDTTGSMGDELTYLQKDFAAIAGEVANENTKFSVNFYKDESDEYVTKCNPFTDDIKNIQKALNDEYASGGGDFPEAVAEILEETLVNGGWSDNTNKIAFLIFDAPPHDGSKNEEKLQRAIQSAAEKGIHVVPVVASNADRSTELFGRAVAIMTNSNYVFLTDDSGVGDSHLEPIVGAYEVELLHDIIVRNINELSAE